MSSTNERADRRLLLSNIIIPNTKMRDREEGREEERGEEWQQVNGEKERWTVIKMDNMRETLKATSDCACGQILCLMSACDLQTLSSNGRQGRNQHPPLHPPAATCHWSPGQQTGNNRDEILG